jgi:hypothetical protein
MHELLVESAGYVIPWIEALGTVVIRTVIVHFLNLELSRDSKHRA